jgi:acetyl esterase/lipase
MAAPVRHTEAVDRVFLAISLNGALYAINALRPVQLRNRWLAFPSFFVSWLTIELAWLQLLAQVAATVFFTRRGALRSARGRMAFGINLLSMVGTAALVWQSLGVRQEVRAAFTGSEERPVPVRRHLGVKVTRNLTYARVEGRSLKLDIYEPRRPALDRPRGTRRPAVLQIHGGAWVLGDKREQGIPLLRHLANQGWVGFNANYRLSPTVAFPEPLIDLKRALAWIREHADEYDIDPDMIVVTGGSAGGHLAALVGLTGNDPAYQPGFEDADTSVQACVPFYGVYDLRSTHYPADTVHRFFGPVVLRASLDRQPEKFAKASPVDQVHAGAPPFLVIHGEIDTLVPVAIAREFVARLRAASKASVVYLELKGAQHAFDVFVSIRGMQVIRAVDRYLDTLWSEHLAGTKVEDVPEGQLGAAVDEA